MKTTLALVAVASLVAGALIFLRQGPPDLDSGTGIDFLPPQSPPGLDSVTGIDFLLHIDMDDGAPPETSIVVKIDGERLVPVTSGYEIYLGRELLGSDRVTISDESLALHGARIAVGRDPVTVGDLVDLLSSGLGLAGEPEDFAESPEESADSIDPIDLLDQARMHRPRNTDEPVLWLAFVTDWRTPGNLADSFAVLYSRERDASQATIALIRLRHTCGVVVSGASASGVSSLDLAADLVRAEWTMALKATPLPLPHPEGRFPRRHVGDAAGWWIEQFTAGEDLPVAGGAPPERGAGGELKPR